MSIENTINTNYYVLFYYNISLEFVMQYKSDQIRILFDVYLVYIGIPNINYSNILYYLCVLYLHVVG